MDFFELFNEQNNAKDTEVKREPSRMAAASSGREPVDENRFVRGLNPEQRQAVLHDQGPLLILAGAGSGKTRVITHRIAYLVSARQVSPWQILAITFTNKAANEMKVRVAELIGDVSKQMWIGTFHSMLARILRKHADLIGYSSNYSIIDGDDQKKVVRDILKELNIDDKQLAPNQVHSAISNAKNNLISAENFLRSSGGGYYNEQVSRIYKLYQQRLKRSDSMDFDDILFYTVELFERHPEVLAIYQQRFNYIMVDEYQDTNGAQYQIVKALAAAHQNLCVVGDDDQSIYSFRGANIRNILDFEKDYSNCTVIKLEQNYRSTDTVLSAANAVIANNKGRKAKKLWTSQPGGEPITFVQEDNNFSEARYVADEIKRRVRRGDLAYSDVAILYRTNAISRNIEQGLREQGIPYRIYGGLRFYDRKEIKDVLAYLRLITQPGDDLSFDRVVNTPKRGIGQTSVMALSSIAASEDRPMLEIAARANLYPELSRVSKRLQEFAHLIASFRQELLKDDYSLPDFVDLVQNVSGLMQEVVEQQEKGKDVTADRIENMKELLSDAQEFIANYSPPADFDDLAAFQDMNALMDRTLHSTEISQGVETAPDETVSSLNAHISLEVLLNAFMEQASLSSSADIAEGDENFVRLMTIHAAKGLEFNLVFLVSAEEGIFPGYRSIGDEEQLEEERRLAYVAITRAKKKLYITTARMRTLYGQTQNFLPSRFIQEIPEQYLDEIGGSARGDRHAYGSRQPGRGQAAAVAAKPGAGTASGTSGSILKGDAAAARKNMNSGMEFLKSGGKREGKPAASAAVDSSVLLPQQIKKGDKVRHDTFGIGDVLQVEPVAGDALVAIRFTSGTKRLMAKFAKLKKA